MYRKTGLLNVDVKKVWKASHGRLYEFMEAEEAEYEMS